MFSSISNVTLDHVLYDNIHFFISDDKILFRIQVIKGLNGMFIIFANCRWPLGPAIKHIFLCIFESKSFSRLVHISLMKGPDTQ